MIRSAKAIVYPKANKVALLEIPFQPAQPTDILVKTILTTVAPGLERMQITGKSVTRRVIKFPVVPGSEMVGEVVWVGEFVHGIEPGELVYVRQGDRWAGAESLFGCNANFVLTHFKHVIPLGTAPMQRAVLSGLLAYAISSVKKINLQELNRVLVLGLGSVGMMAIEYLRYKGFTDIDAVESFAIRGRMSSASAIGISLDDFTEDFNDRYDLVIEATGRLLLIEQVMRLLKPQGKVLLMGNYEVTKYDYRLIQDKEPVLITSSLVQDEHLIEAKRILSDAEFPAEKFITNVFPAHEYEHGLEVALNASEAIKTVFTWR
ncbi:Alcohol dehydrogenase GroES domain protein [Chloroherpeton thalassium ATCC 35110]|uniref:Alcohol dehydrogenase GroES domain protein n=1 Tax=Chloroherpeton thalassium (strain ATCC 35110 / GB-78) TaxID=517418 RepID=B3QRP6_CHLT3|nr:zinc-binding alcohol dehydrogenase [Chloroherpeton thalassium]ACF13849.1 Alcohol dehydrogenase GroES domain protein [Chloroherpeton thalassium ATCC 35110]